MPELKNIKHEKFCKKLITETNTQKSAYKAVYPSVTDATAESNSTQLLNREDVRARCLEILNSTKGLRLNVQLNNLLNLSNARKSVIIDKEIISQAIEDNPTRLEACKSILKLYGALQSNTKDVNIDSKSIVFNVGKDDISNLSTVIEKITNINKRSKISGDIIDI